MRSAIALILLTAWISPAEAQESLWMVVVTSVEGEDSSAAERAGDVAAAHLRSRGQTVLAGRSLETRLAETLSTPFTPANPDLARRITSAADAALLLIAGGDRTQARALLEGPLSEAEQAIVALGREQATAIAVANACLLRVRAALDLGARDEAERLAIECDRLVPAIELDSLTYG